MKPVEIIAQAIGIIAMVFNIVSFQGKKQKTVITLQLLGTALFSVNFLLLGAMVGSILNLLAALRSLLFLYKDKLRAEHKLWFVAFVACYIATYVLNFTVFAKEPTAFNFIIEILPVIGMVSVDVGYRMKTAAAIRKCGLVNAPLWLVYNLVTGSWGAITCDVLTLSSILLGMFRMDKKR
jgi:hypothetical protein